MLLTVRILLILCVFSGCFFFGKSVTPGQSQLTVPIFKGNSIPTPPRQLAPWSPPKTSLPEEFVTAATTLFTQGFADPRDCDYREIEIAGGSVWGGAGTIKTHAWVLPRTTEKDGQQFAIGWNGLVYPVTAVLGQANLRTDIENTIRKDEEGRARYKLEHPDFPFYRFRAAISNYASLSPEMLLPLKACLLLRLGQTDEAERLWSTWTAGMDAKVNDDAIHLRDPYLMLATEWLWALFDRAHTYIVTISWQC